MSPRAKGAIIHRVSPKMSIVHPWIICFDLSMSHEVFDLLNKDSWSDKIWDRYTRFSDYNIFKPEKIIVSLQPVPRLWWV